MTYVNRKFLLFFIYSCKVLLEMLLSWTDAYLELYKSKNCDSSCVDLVMTCSSSEKY
jgi:hypothetical protein